jgi:cytochrome c oxidase subunit II
MPQRHLLFAASGALVEAAVAGPALAGLGQPSPWQTGLQQAGTPVMGDIAWLHDLVLYIMTAIAALVLVLLLIVIARFNQRTNPTPSTTTNNRFIEVSWTVVPVLILFVIGVPSFRFLFQEQNMPPAEVTIKATGKQWFWTYSYPDNGQFEFDSLMLDDSARKAGQPRLLAVDNEMVVPVNQVIRVQVTGADVVHSFAVPSFGIKIDTVPGRLNETWFKATREGVYYGQCSQLCGRNHAFMPIAVRVVGLQEFTAWVEDAKKKFAQDNVSRPSSIASTDSAQAE